MINKEDYCENKITLDMLKAAIDEVLKDKRFSKDAKIYFVDGEYTYEHFQDHPMPVRCLTGFRIGIADKIGVHYVCIETERNGITYLNWSD